MRFRGVWESQTFRLIRSAARIALAARLRGFARRRFARSLGLAACAGFAPAGLARARALAAAALAAIGQGLAAFSFGQRGLAFAFLALGAPQIAFVLPLALVFRRACLVQRDRDRLPRVLYLSWATARAALEFAVLELVHHAFDGLLLRSRLLGHDWTPGVDSRVNPERGCFVSRAGTAA